VKKKIRLGLLLDSYEIPAWAYAMLERVQREGYAEIVLVVLNGSPVGERSFRQRLSHALKYALYTAFINLDRRRFKPKEDAFQKKDVRILVGEIPVLKVTPRQTKLSDYVLDEDIEKIKAHQVDVFVRHGFRILRGKILTVAPCGVWSYHHGDNRDNRGGPAGFWEVMENHPWTGSILQILTEDLDNGLVLYRSFGATHYLSVRLNRSRYYWKSAAFLPRKLKELYELGADEFLRRVRTANIEPGFYSQRLYMMPDNNEFWKPFWRYMWRYIQNKWKTTTRFEQWFLQYDLREGISSSAWRFKKILPPKDRFWADPHILYRDGSYFIFIEEYIYSTKRGRISVIRMDEKGNYQSPEVVLERPYHLAYPFIFEWQGELYMLPETVENHTLEVYRCLEFPGRWELCQTLMQGVEAVDATLHFDGKKWWLFSNMVEFPGASSHDELFLFSADSPLSTEWKPHPKNPVCSDVRRARPAGRIFELNGSIYRPSQDCSHRYGYGIHVNKILRLDDEEFKEEEVGFIEPDWDETIVGTHSLSWYKRLTVMDGVQWRRK
jgi:hypothetical protein